MNTPPLLKPKHFALTACRLTPRGLQYAAALPEVSDIRLVLHPARPTAKHLKEVLTRAQERSLAGEKIGIGHEFPEKYDRRWSRSGSEDDEDDPDQEGQHLILVAYWRTRAVGFSNLAVSLMHPLKDEGSDLSLYFNLHMVYVAPHYRSRGIGSTMAIAMAEICQSILEATHSAAPDGANISLCMLADYYSKGGQIFTERIYDYLEVRRKSLQYRKPEVSVGKVLLDAGW